MIVFVGGQMFNWFMGQKAQSEPFLHSLSQLKVSTLDSPSGWTKTREPLLAARTYSHYFWQMADTLLFQKVGRMATTCYLAHFIGTLRSQQTIFISPYQRDLFSSFSLFSCSWAISSLWLCFRCLRSVLLCKRVIVTSVWLIGQHPSAPLALRHAQTDRKVDRIDRLQLDRQMNKDTEVQTGRVLCLPHDKGRRQINSGERVDCDLIVQTVSKQLALAYSQCHSVLVVEAASRFPM